ncbi:hypothetical protein, partial [Rhodovulum sp. 12E13]|uniref:hypothetical protein n=1 Tax=Rhodovulum sp. 12E13 TaxID=2203891 RepID=UPI001F1D9437
RRTSPPTVDGTPPEKTEPRVTSTSSRRCSPQLHAPTRFADTAPREVFRTRLKSDAGLAERWAQNLARTVQAARLRAEIRSLPRVADRLDAWLADGQSLPERGRWQEVAAELGITREALYRDLARRRAGKTKT